MSIEILGTAIAGCRELRCAPFADQRGRFVKVVHATEFAAAGLESAFAEQFYSVSAAGVVRGLHLQLPPYEHAKLVYCPSGAAFDVVVDLRVGSPTYGRHASFALSAERGNAVYIPAGLAHGFQALVPGTLVVYNTTSVHAPAADGGIRWDSAGIAWPLPAGPLSERDRALPPLERFVSPFAFGGGR